MRKHVPRLEVIISIHGEFLEFLHEESPSLVQLVGIPSLVSGFLTRNIWGVFFATTLIWGLIFQFLLPRAKKHLDTMWQTKQAEAFEYDYHHTTVIGLWFMFIYIYSILITLFVPFVIYGVTNRP